MKIELLGMLDYEKIKTELKEKVENVDEVIDMLKKNETEKRAQIVSSAGRLSRFTGNVFDVLEISENNSFEKNLKFIKRVTGMGHDSITDHDYLVFAIQDVSPVIEQIIIAERFCSFTIKSRREVDFSNVGFYTPNFHDDNGNVLENNYEIKEQYQEYMKSLFKKYSEFEGMGIPKEDARFILPYCYYSNILMGIDAHVLRDMIIKFTKTKYSKIQELREFGERLLEIANDKVPYLTELVEKEECSYVDEIETYLNKYVSENEKNYKILEKVRLINSTPEVDKTILVSAFMRRYQLDKENAEALYKKVTNDNPDFKKNLMRKIAFDGDKLELTQVNFDFQVPISFAVLTHLTRHRTHQIMIPDFVPNVNLSNYKTPPQIKAKCKEEYDKVYKENVEMYELFKKKYKICENDLIYFTLSGNMVNVITNMDGKTLKHILALRECTKAQWETREMATNMHAEIDTLKGADEYSAILGPSCVTQGYCKEGKESCGRINNIK